MIILYLGPPFVVLATSIVMLVCFVHRIAFSTTDEQRWSLVAYVSFGLWTISAILTYFIWKDAAWY